MAYLAHISPGKGTATFETRVPCDLGGQVMIVLGVVAGAAVVLLGCVWISHGSSEHGLIPNGMAFMGGLMLICLPAGLKMATRFSRTRITAK